MGCNFMGIYNHLPNIEAAVVKLGRTVPSFVNI